MTVGLNQDLVELCRCFWGKKKMKNNERCVVIRMVRRGEREKVEMEGRWGARAYKGYVSVLLVS